MEPLVHTANAWEEIAMAPHDTHDHDHDHSIVPDDTALRVKALESLLIEKGLVDPAALDAIVDYYEHKVGPRNGARVVARAWSDPTYKARLLTDATAAIAELGYAGRQGDHMVVVENTPEIHNMVVCTLCSCYLVLPARPSGTEAMTEEQLAELVTRDAMIGVAQVPAP
jgi:nitrile hydratase